MANPPTNPLFFLYLYFLYDVTPLLELPAFQVHKDVNVFNKVYIDFDTVTWCNEDIDIAPETLFKDGTDYEQSIVS